MRRIGPSFAILALSIVTSIALASAQQDARPIPQYQDKQLIRPDGYREWIYLSSGLGMNYNPVPQAAPQFTNVFVPQFDYHQFMATGKWPDKTVFVLEQRTAETKGSINKDGHFQTDLNGLVVEVKDQTRFPETWAYFSFPGEKKTADANPKQACWQCHEDHAASDHTFVQFYPTLKPVAQKFGTYHEKAPTPPVGR